MIVARSGDVCVVLVLLCVSCARGAVFMVLLCVWCCYSRAGVLVVVFDLAVRVVLCVCVGLCVCVLCDRVVVLVVPECCVSARGADVVMEVCAYCVVCRYRGVLVVL